MGETIITETAEDWAKHAIVRWQMGRRHYEGSVAEWRAVEAEWKRARAEWERAALVQGKAGQVAVEEAGLAAGDRVEWPTPDLFGLPCVLSGTLYFARGTGIARVRLDPGQAVNKRFTRWHKGWRKIDTPESTL